ncbi:hypothetical protein J1614_002076 [Plenodomus biglobosus]|nr:hypothetical protein J1614_002076 [Plenodomus biglobosus]
MRSSLKYALLSVQACDKCPQQSAESIDYLKVILFKYASAQPEEEVFEGSPDLQLVERGTRVTYKATTRLHNCENHIETGLLYRLCDAVRWRLLHCKPIDQGHPYNEAKAFCYLWTPTQNLESPPVLRKAESTASSRLRCGDNFL